MIPLTDLWLPILLSTVIVFFASFIMHMVLSYHKVITANCPTKTV